MPTIAARTYQLQLVNSNALRFSQFNSQPLRIRHNWLLKWIATDRVLESSNFFHDRIFEREPRRTRHATPYCPGLPYVDRQVSNG